MKTVRRLSATVVLALTLSIFASGGEISGPGVTTPPPPPPPQFSMIADTSITDATVTGDISTSGVTELDPLTEAALSLLQSVLSLF
jgi:hypothetical protein